MQETKENGDTQSTLLKFPSQATVHFTSQEEVLKPLVTRVFSLYKL